MQQIRRRGSNGARQERLLREHAPDPAPGIEPKRDDVDAFAPVLARGGPAEEQRHLEVRIRVAKRRQQPPRVDLGATRLARHEVQEVVGDVHRQLRP